MILKVLSDEELSDVELVHNFWEFDASDVRALAEAQRKADARAIVDALKNTTNSHASGLDPLIRELEEEAK